jgi:hypothetical protein
MNILEIAKKHGAIVHSDGNTFFTNADKLEAFAAELQRDTLAKIAPLFTHPTKEQENEKLRAELAVYQNMKPVAYIRKEPLDKQILNSDATKWEFAPSFVCVKSLDELTGAERDFGWIEVFAHPTKEQGK